MATDANLRGVYIPIITPFADDGSVAIDAVERCATSTSTPVRRASSRSARPASRPRSMPTRSTP